MVRCSRASSCKALSNESQREGLSILRGGMRCHYIYGYII